eukprot:TRINITY_DN8811_c0_g1_i1.p1 TRINITY_DN8811_c0_g1~~TRINITY_DN8811_c0_g1_i1.p1  ORF type:complete len:677 (+),score=145.34 TRINITY_DN8811_c0_g1_i1:286-2316(+)
MVLDPAATRKVLFKLELGTPEFEKLKATMPHLADEKLVVYTRGLWNLVQKQDHERLLQVSQVFNDRIIAEMHDSAGRSIIHFAAFLGSLECLKVLLRICPSAMSDRDTDKARGGMAIHYASWAGNQEVVTHLLGNGATLDDRDLVGNSPMLYAIFGGRISLIKHYERLGASLLERNSKGHSAVIQAACGGHLDVVQYLLARGATVDERDNIGNTCLLFAAWGGHLELVQWLLSHGASLADQSNTGHTVLLSAANSGSLHVVQWLLEVAKVDPQQRNRNGDTCLLLAAFGGHCKLLSWLLDNNVATLDETNTDGLDPLMSACNGGHLPMVKLLMKLGCRLNHVNSSGYSPLILAACGGHVHLVEWLYQQGCSLTDSTNEGDSPLLLACYCGHVKLVHWLLERGLSLDVRNNAGLTPLISAANGGHPEVLELLIRAGADMEETDNEGYTAFLLAVRRGYLNSARRLAMFGADMSVRTKNGLDAIALAFEYDKTRDWLKNVRDYTPLHVALFAKAPRHVRRLLRNGANPHALTLRNAPPTCVAMAQELMPECSSLAALVVKAARRWTPQTHQLFGPKYRQHAVITMVLANRLAVDRPDLPLLPTEVWHHVIAMLGRRVEDGRAPTIKPAALTPAPPNLSLSLMSSVSSIRLRGMDDSSDDNDLEYVSESMDEESDLEHS